MAINVKDRTDMPAENLLEMRDIHMSFGPVEVLHGVDLVLRKNEVLALVGENGAGKSTLIKILAGNYPQKSGKIIFKGEELEFRGPLERIRDGIAIIYQELNYFDDLTVAENIFVGRIPVKGLLKKVDRKEMNAQAQKILDRIGLKVHPDDLCSSLTVAQKQLLEIGKAVSKDVKVVVMDEPTSALNDVEVSNLFDIVRKLKSEGISIIYISHKLDEIFHICDRVEILRDGETVVQKDIDKISKEEIVNHMVGKTIGNLFPSHDTQIGEVLLDVRDMTIESEKVRKVSMKVHKGEIVSIYGLMGSGSDELVKTFFGLNKVKEGIIYYKGTPIEIRNPRNAVEMGIAYVPSERKTEGVILCHSIKQNISIALLEKIKKGISVNKDVENKLVDDAMGTLSIKSNGADALVSSLSGGNQQKVVLAKWILTEPDLIIVNEPTKGIDVGAKAEVYKVLERMCADGMGVIMISTELPEVVAMSDRIYVMNEGEMSAELSREEADQEKLMKYAIGGME